MEPEVAHIHGFLVAIEVNGIITTVLCKSYAHVVLRNLRFVLAKYCRNFADISQRLKTIFRRNGRDSSPCQTKSRHFAEQNEAIDKSSRRRKFACPKFFYCEANLGKFPTYKVQGNTARTRTPGWDALATHSHPALRFYLTVCWYQFMHLGRQNVYLRKQHDPVFLNDLSPRSY